MNLIVNLFNTILYRPLFNTLVFLYQYLPGHDFGVAVIALTILIRVILHPLMVRTLKSQKALSELQPKIEEIQKKYNGDRERQAKELFLLYQKEKINPFSGFLFLLIQLPILIALFRVFQTGFGQEQLRLLYSFIPPPRQINTYFLGTIDLAKGCSEKIIANGIEYSLLFWPTIILVILVGITQFIQTKMITLKQKSVKKGPPDLSQMIRKQMLYFFPIFTIFILWKLPAAIALYWLITSLFSIIQQHFYAKPS